MRNFIARLVCTLLRVPIRLVYTAASRVLWASLSAILQPETGRYKLSQTKPDRFLDQALSESESC
jgi:hypothetical protein